MELALRAAVRSREHTTESDMAAGEIEDYKQLVNRSISRNNRDFVLGSTVEHKIVLLSLLFEKTALQLAKDPTTKVVRMLISNKIDIINRECYNDYLVNLNKALTHGIRIKILFTNVNQYLQDNLTIMRNYSHPKKKQIDTRVESGKVEDISYYKGQSLAENNFNFDVFGSKAFRVEIL